MPSSLRAQHIEALLKHGAGGGLTPDNCIARDLIGFLQLASAVICNLACRVRNRRVLGGLAELTAGAISMGLGGYVGAKSEA